MGDIGKFLKASRAEAGLTLEQVSQNTKVRTGLLTKLEENKLSELPERVFVRGFVTAYADAVGASKADALEILEEQYTRFQLMDGRVEDVIPYVQASNDIARSGIHFRPAYFVLILLAVLAFTVAVFVQKSPAHKTISAAEKTDVNSGTTKTINDFHRRQH